MSPNPDFNKYITSLQDKVEIRMSMMYNTIGMYPIIIVITIIDHMAHILRDAPGNTCTKRGYKMLSLAFTVGTKYTYCT